LYFAGGQARTIDAAEGPPAFVNVFGNSRQTWKQGIPAYGGIAYRDLYPGIDAIYDGAHNGLKCEFRVAPGADPSHIRLEYGGMERLQLEPDGALLLETKSGSLRESPPEVYQEISGVRHSIPAAFRVLER